MNKVISCEKYGGSWRVEVITPSGARMVLLCEGSRAQAMEKACWSRVEVEPA